MLDRGRRSPRRRCKQRVGWSASRPARSCPLGSGSGVCRSPGRERPAPASSQLQLAGPQLSATFTAGYPRAEDTQSSGFFLSPGWLVCLAEGRCIGNQRRGYEVKAQLCANEMYAEFVFILSLPIHLPCPHLESPQTS